MKAVTIPKSVAGKEDLIVLPKSKYEELVRRAIPEVSLTAAERRAVKASERELKRGKFLKLNQLRHDLGRSRT